MQTRGLDALVKASRTVNTPSADDRERNRRHLAGRIAAGAVVVFGAHEAAATAGAHGAGGWASAWLSGGLAKWIAVSLVVAGSGAGMAAYLARGTAGSRPPAVVAEARKPTTAPLAAAPPASADATPATAQAPSESASPVNAVVPASSAVSGSAVGARAFERELELLRAARRALDTGSPARALSFLDRYAAEFPHGSLRSECQAARILALCSAGQLAAGQQARDQFLKQQPNSPLAGRVRASCGGAP